MNCTVCTDPYTDTVRKKIDCPFCEYSACVKCIKTYFLTTTNEFHCLNCKKPWTLDFVSHFVTQAWLHGDYKAFKRQLLLDQEKSMLPHSQHMVSNYKLCKDIEAQASVLEKEILERQNQLRELRNSIYDLKANRYMASQNGGPAERRAFIKACPVSDCRGFLNNQYHCGTCDAFACSACLDVKTRGVEHTCDPDKVASVQLIAKDSKPCPNCASVIFKQSGCDYMWCTVCHVSFSWKTGRIEKGVNHNPHYYEWLREHTPGGEAPRNPGDEVCGGMPGYNSVIKKLVLWNVSKEQRFQIMECHRMVRHVRLTMNVPIDRTEFANADIRLKYLLKELDDDLFGRIIYNRYIDRVRKEIFNGLYSLAADIGEELFRKLVASDSPTIIPDFFREITEIKNYVNRNLEHYSKLYKVKLRTLDW
jgi:hypothetical protein